MRMSIAKTGHKHSKETRKKISDCQRGPDNDRWLGDKVGYQGLHDWLRRIYGKLLFCEICKRDDRKRYDWSNKTGKYERKIENWWRLCRKCHIKYDKDNNIKMPINQ